MAYSWCQDYNVHSILKLLAGLSFPSRLKIQGLNRYTSNTQNLHEMSLVIMYYQQMATLFNLYSIFYLFRWSEFHATVACKHSNLGRRFKRDFARNIFWAWVRIDMSFKYLHVVQFKLNIFKILTQIGLKIFKQNGHNLLLE